MTNHYDKDWLREHELKVALTINNLRCGLWGHE